jgi:hypothetical protein
MHSTDMRSKELLLPLGKFSLPWKGVTYSSIQIFNKLQLKISILHRDEITFKSALMKFLVKNAFYSADEEFYLLIMMLISTYLF